MSELPKAFDPKLIEEKHYLFWEKNGFFKADNRSSKPPYCIVMPPPNVTGGLHMGHALVNTLQDILIRWKRMSGFETLWVPGTDHAGIATQTIVERHLIATTGKRRKDFTREEFLSHVWKWKEENEQNILKQIKRLGCSCDFSRLAFTMDEKRNRAVLTLFKLLFDRGLIYQGDYLVNWDPLTQTALADDEVEYEEKEGFIWHIRYPIEGENLSIIIATTRPETMLGDTAVAVSPEDSRYRSLIGKKIRLPLSDRLIPIIADNHVDPAFGTGAVKITPAHDPNDYQIALRHNLPMINIMTPDGKINEKGGEYQGLSMQEARQAIVKRLQELKILVKTELHHHRIGVSYRSKAVIEPYLSKQWFVKMSHFKEKLIDAVKNKKVRLIPERWESTYFHWIDNLRDWCISRQLWWGHRIPIFYNRKDPTKIICSAEEDPPPEVVSHPNEWIQDEDVLDTWFSSQLWPCSVLGWPEKTDDLKKFYPNSTLITGHDILFFWVARMIFTGEFAMGEPPFPETYLHGLIYGKSYWRYREDGSLVYITGKERISYDLGQPIPSSIHFKWEKMSKSKGNIIDPLEMIDTYGTDAVRMALSASPTSSPQIDLDRRKFEEFKNFANKIWNGARFVFMNLTPFSDFGIRTDLLKLEDRWILSLLNRTIQEVNAHLNDYAFDKASMRAYEFFWKEFCAYYLELAKPVLFEKQGSLEEKINKQNLLLVLLSNSIRLLHPMAPFITEELFQLLKQTFSKLPEKIDDLYVRETIEALRFPACIVAPYPKIISVTDIDPKVEETFAFMDHLVHAVRNIRAEMQLPPNVPNDLIIVGRELNVVKENKSILLALVKIDQLTFQTDEKPLPFAASAIVGNLKLIIPLPEAMREKEKLRLHKEQEKLIAQQNQMREQLGNEAFTKRAPKAIVEKLKEGLVQSEKELNDLIQKLKQLQQ